MGPTTILYLERLRKSHDPVVRTGADLSKRFGETMENDSPSSKYSEGQIR